MFKVKFLYSIILTQSLLVFCFETERNASGRKFVTHTYKQAFNPLVRSILEGNTRRFNMLLACNVWDIHIKLPFARNLRHIAYEKEINDRLLALGVAPVGEKIIIFVPANKGDRYICSYERDSSDADVYGKFPEQFDDEEKRELARQMMEDTYVYEE